MRLPGPEKNLEEHRFCCQASGSVKSIVLLAQNPMSTNAVCSAEDLHAARAAFSGYSLVQRRVPLALPRPKVCPLRK